RVRRAPRGEQEGTLVALGHYEAADELRARDPRGGIRILLGAVTSGVADVERVREALAEVVRRSRLERLAVAHQRFEREGVDSAGEALALALSTSQDRDREELLDCVCVDVVQDRQRFCDGLLLGLVRGMALLPEKLARA